MGGAAWLRSVARLTRPISWIRPFQAKSAKGSAIFDDEARARHPSYAKSSYHAIAEMYELTKKLKPRIKQISAPILIMHARQDKVIQPENAPWIYEQVSSKLKKLVWLEHSNHIITEDFDHPIVTREAVKWIELVESKNPLGVAGPRG
jgi:carboxylesterase